MKITRDNYETFLVLYADNELNAAAKAIVEAFLAENPDMQPELDGLLKARVSPDTGIRFDQKQALQKNTFWQLPVTPENSAYFLMLHADGELTGPEKSVVEDFLRLYPQGQELPYPSSRLKSIADTRMVFEHKESLYHQAPGRRPVLLYWWKPLAAAAVIIVFVSGIVLFHHQPITGGTGMARNHQDARPPQEMAVVAPAHIALAAKPAVKGNREKAIARPGHFIARPATRNNTLRKEQDNKHEEQLLALQEEQQEISSRLIRPASSTVMAAAGNHPGIKMPMPGQLAVTATLPAVNLPRTNSSDEPDDSGRIELLNTSFNTKIRFRGLLRKASRLITKKTQTAHEGENHKTILIGGFEIALR